MGIPVTIINVFHAYHESIIATASVPPIGVCYLAAVLEENGHQVTVIDGLGEAIDQTYQHGIFGLRGLKPEEIVERIPAEASLIAVSNLFGCTYPPTGDLVSMIKRERGDVPIIFGGVTPSSMPEHTLSHFEVDYVGLGEGEMILLEVARRVGSGEDPKSINGLAYRNGNEVMINPRWNLVEDLDSLPFPMYDKIPFENYIQAREFHGASRGRTAPIVATRGCPHKCTFCTAPGHWLPRWRTRSPENVLDEIQLLQKNYDITDIHFEDLTIGSDRKWLIRFCEGIEERGMNFTWQIPNGTRSEQLSLELLSMMKRSGCTNITYAPESGSSRVLNLVDKELDLSVIERAVKWSDELDISTCGFFLIGMPGERYEEAKETVNYMLKLARMGLDEIAISTFVPLPGSRLFQELYSSGQLELNDEFFRDLATDDLFKAVSWSEHITDGQLTRLRLFAYLFFFMTSYFFHPRKLFSTLKSLFSQVQETKSQRILKTKMKRVYMNLLGRVHG
ncbi:MAG: B12-binding domain-containing radical SAM protein [Candidatus Glassbacteria bacterium]